MAFSSLAANQMVSEADAATSSFILQSGQSHGSSNQCMDKTAATTKYSINPSALSYYTSNQLIPKSVWEGYVVSYAGYYNTLNDACIDGPSAPHYNIWIDTTSVIVGSRLFLNVNLTTVATGFSVGYYHIASSGEIFQANSSGYITSITSCTDTTPPTAPTTVSANLSGGTVLVTWGGATDNVGIDSYEVFHSTDAVTYDFLDYASSEAYIHDFYVSGFNYYKIRTVDTSFNKSPFSVAASIFM